MARRQSELPVTFAAFAERSLSVDQVTVIAARVPVHNDAEACTLARSATVAQPRVALSKHFLTYPKTEPDDDDDGSASSARPDPTPTPEAPAAAAAAEHRLSTGFDDDGDFFLHGLTNPTDGAIISKALQEAKDRLLRDGNTDVTWLEALVDVCTRSLGAISSPSRRDLFKLIVHLDSEGAWIHGGPRIPASLRDNLSCDGIIQPLWSKDGLPINIGRQQHIVPLRTRIVVEDRDRMCTHPICASTAGLQIHHILHWTKGGPSDTNNLCCLCQRHHHQHHRGELTIEGDADEAGGLTFRDRNGKIIQPCGTPTPPGNRPPPSPTTPYIHPTGERMHLKWLDFTQPPPPNPPPFGEN